MMAAGRDRRPRAPHDSSPVRLEARARAGLPRALELPLAVVALVLSAPLLALAGLAITITTRDGVIFSQERVGLGGRRFRLFKLRTMRDEPKGPSVTSAGDPRITRVGRLLRKFKIDELPGLWNVIRGEMALVGPRPEVPRYVDLDQPIWRQVLAVRPGLTDPVTLRLRNEESLLAQVDGDREAFYRHTLQPHKLYGYVDYLHRRTWTTDFAILARTAWAVVAPSRSSAPTPNELTPSRSDE